MKMALDAPTIASTNSTLCLLTNVKTLLGLNVIMPLLEANHSLIKFSQLRDVFVGAFIAVRKFVKGMYIRCIVTTNFISKVMCLEISMPLSIMFMKAYFLMDHKSKCKNKSFNF
jgi:hypothetical protein